MRRERRPRERETETDGKWFIVVRVKGEVHRVTGRRPESKDQHGTEASVVMCTDRSRCVCDAKEQTSTRLLKYKSGSEAERGETVREVKSPVSVHGSQRATGEIMSGEGE